MNLVFLTYTDRYKNLQHVCLVDRHYCNDFIRNWEKIARQVSRRKEWNGDDIMDEFKKKHPEDVKRLISYHSTHLVSTPAEVKKLQPVRKRR